MAKKLTQLDCETILIALGKYYAEIEETHPNLSATLEHIDELGKEFFERAEKASKGWGVSYGSRWGGLN